MDFTLSWEKALADYRYKYLALYHAIRSKIRDGSLKEGTRLPASREMASLYGLSRGSVAQAYDMLLAEGYVYARVGQGTFVAAIFAKGAETLAEDDQGIGAGKERAQLAENASELKRKRDGYKGQEAGLQLSSWGQRLLALRGMREKAGRDISEPSLAQAGGVIVNSPAEFGMAGAAEHGGVKAMEPSGTGAGTGSAEPDADPAGEMAAAQPAISFAGSITQPPPEFPHAAWRSALARASAEPYASPADVFGDAELRAAIAAHLRATRGIAADPASICCFSGSMQAIALLSQLLLGEGARAVAEDPGYPGIRLAAAAAGAAVIPAEVDGRGLIPRDWDARVLFVTPGRQFPTGAVLTPERRRELLAWAERRNAVIVEDDFDSEFRWAGQPMEPLMAQDRGERVVFVGTFTKTLFSALRIGYAVLPRPLIEPMRQAKALFEPAPPAMLEQRTLARFMARGDYDKHLRRMRRIYGVRYEVFRSEMEDRLGGLFTPLPLHSGLHVYAEWRRSMEEYKQFRAACSLEGVYFRDVEGFWMGPHGPAACFFFAHLKPEEISDGLSRMEAAGRKIWADGVHVV